VPFDIGIFACSDSDRSFRCQAPGFSSREAVADLSSDRLTLALGYISFLGMLPVIPVALIGGAIIDRVPKRKLIVVTQAGLMLQALLPGGADLERSVQRRHLVLLVTDVRHPGSESICRPARLSWSSW